ncbi:MAG TPA: J domain-containing protein [Acidimicrobiia bacterium]|nr:J domain-containing protein [Acidimicrobiia bacterium]
MELLLAELNVRHTRRHMPTRRVALDDSYLPTSGSAFGAVLLGAVVAEHVPGLDEEQLDALGRLVDAARNGLTVPRIALRYRLQTDTHGLDLSRHRVIGADVRTGSVWPVLELDRHGPAAPQVIGAIMAAAALPPSGRKIALRFVDAAVARPGFLPEGLDVHRMFEGLPGLRPYAPGARPAPGSPDEWRGVPSERRWAMEVLGLRAGMEVERDDVQRRFRRLVRLAHPDHGAGNTGAAERIAELADAREVLLGFVDSADAQPAG